MANVLVILSGCGVFDGSEIHESVITLLHLDRADATVTIAAPNLDQMHGVNHLTGEPTHETRNVLIESARIARGEVEDLAGIRGDAFDAIIFPGGYGAAKNLCNFATEADHCEVHPEVARILREAHQASKPIGLICISPTIGAKVITGSTLTIGTDETTAAAIEKMGSHHQPRQTEEICVDQCNRIVSTPAYMSAERISEVYEGIGKLVERVLQMAQQQSPQPMHAND
ncbi:MAG: isoprenoid biosynthesis glyoxalase ElbB [Phycisphaerales bacterium]|nr:isoprenoid biosynthesis glyoxalase ElbB [Planctomycetota bacterium]MCZ6851208.1 isoprenoid biosynthesis glyoxalase ElbB [Planctomycetota bacterium]